jgi:hypothetical protein
MVDPHYAFLDESPSLSDPEHFFVVALVATKAAHLTTLRRLPKRVRTRVLGKQLRNVPELKFYNSDERIRQRMMTLIARQDVGLAIFIVDKQGRRIGDTPLHYGVVVGSAVRTYLTAIYPHLHLTVDKKYTSPSERTKFQQVVERMVVAAAPEATFSLTAQVESQREPLIQLADFVAGAVHHKYNRGNSLYFDIIRERIVLEQQMVWAELMAAAVNVVGE